MVQKNGVLSEVVEQEHGLCLRSCVIVGQMTGESIQ